MSVGSELRGVPLYQASFHLSHSLLLVWPVSLVCASTGPPPSSGQRSGCIDLNLRKPSKLTFLRVHVGPHNKHTCYLLLWLRGKKMLKDPFFFYKTNRFQFLTSLPQPQLIPRAKDVHLDKSVSWLETWFLRSNLCIYFCTSQFSVCIVG